MNGRKLSASIYARLRADKEYMPSARRDNSHRAKSTRRQARNVTGIPRIANIAMHDAWVHFRCVSCHGDNCIRIGKSLLAPGDALETAEWKCEHRDFVHAKDEPLPFAHWDEKARKSGSLPAVRFWTGFFKSATERPDSYWKQCNTCSRVLPFNAFSRHEGWGPLERQMECRACKGAINAILNPKRTREQLQEGARSRRAGDLLLEGQNERIDLADLFERFEHRCFKTGKPLKIDERNTWEIDHICPSRYLYPLTRANAALLSRGANENKRDQWPSKFYTNSELKRLAEITGGNLELWSSPSPVLNTRVDVDAAVRRALEVRERSNLHKRIVQLKQFLMDYKLLDRLSADTARRLGIETGSQSKIR